jgi:hypothetical protein
MRRALMVALALVLLAGFTPATAESSGPSPPELSLAATPMEPLVDLLHYAILDTALLDAEHAGLTAGAPPGTERPSSYLSERGRPPAIVRRE